MSNKNTKRRSIAQIAASYEAAGREDLANVAREAFENETARCVSVSKLCDEAGLGARALEMIESRRTVEEVRELLHRAAVTAKWDRTIDATKLPN